MDNPVNYIFQIWQETPSGSKLRNSRSSEVAVDPPVQKLTNSDSDTVFLRRKSNFIAPRKFHLSPKQTKILATLVPDIVVTCDDLIHKNINPFLGVLLYADISGFTALSEKCSTLGDSGVYKLTAAVNGFLGKMVASIYSCGGDVWKFSGDAFLAIWKVKISDNFAHVIHCALRCALDIQKNHGYYETEFKTILRVKLGMSAGNVTWCMVGDESSRRTILVGSPVIEVKKAERACLSGDVILTSSVWGHISPRDCVHEVLQGGHFTRVTRILGYLGLTSPTLMKLVGAPGTEEVVRNKHSNHGVRHFSELSGSSELGSELRLCVLPPVVQQVDADLSLDYLTELRTLTLMIINIIPRKLLTTDLIAVVDKAYIIIHSLVIKAGGFVDKVSLFDKDIMFVTVFGLRGFVHEGRVAACLSCGYDIREACIAIVGVHNVSVGITTGMTYCGVVGHPLRQEFTVIGPAVNKAARIMCAYKGQVTCDSATYEAADLSPDCFIPAPYRPLRGFATEDSSYEYSPEKSRMLHLALQRGLPPLLGRDEEIDQCRRLLRDLNSPDRASRGFLIVGNAKIGKSRLLDEMVAEAYRSGMAPTVLGLRSGHSIVPFGAAVHILCHVLMLTKEDPHSEVEACVTQLLSSHLTPVELTAMKEMFQRPTPHLNDPVIVDDNMKRTFSLALSLGMSSPILAIDDVDLCDAASWELIMAAVESQRKVFLLTSQPGRGSCHVPTSTVPHISVMHLEPLPLPWVAPLACQFLQVEAIQSEILSFLELRSEGNPGWCRAHLQTLEDNNYVEVREVDAGKALSMRLYCPSPHLLDSVSTNFPPLPTPLPPVPRDNDEWPDQVEFDYHDHRSLIHTMSVQQWWKRMSKFVWKSAARKRSRLVNEIMVDRRVSLRTEDIKKYNRFRTGPVEWAQLVRDMFGYGSELMKTSDPSSGVKIVPTNVTSDEALIQESLDAFRKMKESRGADIDDSQLDSLQKQKKKYTQGNDLRDLKEESNGDEEDEITMKIVKSTRPSTSLAAQSMMLPVLREQGVVVAILKVPGMNLDVTATPESFVGLLSIFDSLRPYEQLLLKCGSVIGNKFKRATLDAILHYPSASYTSLAIKRLFDLNILCCTRVNRRLSEKRCSCQQPRNSLPDFSLPQYAFCSNLGFQHPKFRETLYDLLPPNQKRLFHERAVEFLAAQPRRCQVCETQIVGEPHPPRIRSVQSNNTRGSTDSNRSDGFTKGRSSSGIAKLLQALMSVPIPDLRGCTCAAVEGEILSELICHCKAAGLVEYAMNYSISYARACVATESFSEARTIVNLVQVQIKENDSLNPREKAALLAESELLLGELAFHTSSWDTAMAHLLAVLHIAAPCCPPATAWRIRRLRLPFLSRVWLLTRQRRGSRATARALVIITNILMIKKQMKEAQVVCTAAVKLLTGLDDPVELCKVYADMVDIQLSLQGHLLDLDPDDRMVAAALRLLPIRSVKEAAALGRLIYAIYIIRAMGAGDLVVGSDLLAGLSRLSQRMPMVRGRELVTLEMYHVHTLLGNVREAVDTLLSLRRGSSSQQFWFHVLCLDFVRATGFWVEKPQESQDFLMYALMEASPHSRAYKSGTVVLLLWMLITDPQRGLQWQPRSALPSQPQPVRCVGDCVWRLLELLALVLQARVMPVGAPWGPRLNRTLRTWLTELGVMAQRFRVMQPMYLHLRAYIAFRLERNVPRAQQLLADAGKAAQQQGNDLVATRIALTRETWRLGGDRHSVPVPSAQGREWTEWRRADWAEALIKLP